FCELVVVNFILQKRLPFLYGFFHLHKIFYTLFKKESGKISLPNNFIFHFITTSCRLTPMRRLFLHKNIELKK
ncbi:MAG: hypothetical protein E7B72_10725, partial [Enterococcus faecalis]|nr:hypothetical protein [Enterococcus faecalis]